MKGRHRKHRATGGVNEAAEDMGKKNMRYTYQSNVNDAAEERKHGGRAHKKHAGKVHGEKSKMHAGRKPRRSGGRLAGTDWAAAQHGTAPKGRKLEMN